MNASSQPQRIGLGIDAGGTFTDLALYDFAANVLLDKGKTPTTHWSYAVGVGKGLSLLNQELLEHVQLVSVSTTLATNAVVEGRGQKVGLLIMPQQGLFDPQEIGHHPQAVVQGRMDINGRELEPVCPDEIRQAARALVSDQEVTAFAVSGYAGSVNPMHEIQVKELLRASTGLSVTCGHELSSMLNFIARARTAVINARIIPYLESFLSSLSSILDSFSIHAPIAVVKGDGSLMSLSTALERPVETVLSGPAASVAGGRKLTGIENALVVDMGGTTTDVASIRQGQVSLCESGALLGTLRTHVRAIDVTTSGLGGDSRIALHKGDIAFGPERVTPLSRVQAQWPAVLKAIDFLEFRLNSSQGDPRWTDILCLADAPPPLSQLSPEEGAIVKALKERPRSLPELAEQCRSLHWNLLKVDRLEQQGVVARCGLTPTDLLRIKGEINLGRPEAPQRMAGLLARLNGFPDKGLVDRLLDLIVQTLARDLFLANLPEERGISTQRPCPLCTTLFEAAFEKTNPDFAVQLTLSRPLVGIGAPARSFLTRAGALLNARTLVPDHAEVANAIGAITSSVHLEKEVQIKPGPEGALVIVGLPAPDTFEDLAAATEWVMDRLDRDLRGIARTNGATGAQTEFDFQDREASIGEGSSLFLGRVVKATVRGDPGALHQLGNGCSLSQAPCGTGAWCTPS